MCFLLLQVNCYLKICIGILFNRNLGVFSFFGISCSCFVWDGFGKIFFFGVYL